jgi:hypothetical protein
MQAVTRQVHIQRERISGLEMRDSRADTWQEASKTLRFIDVY